MQKNRLLWASRRGMLELDLLLQPFVENHYDLLSDDDKQQFHLFLELEDQQLFQWLVQKEKASDSNTQRIIDIIYASRKRTQ
ncbi:succinate dehydrogenase assembly factor 2 [Porticoccaceae bacterium]|nr:succinate dehydrogenase assembly factor 2 [Porticoccaceae bacterium]MDA9014313.1 succinate dehydrogenase assembly factor 2 [Porticoccaceae bacterium]